MTPDSWEIANGLLMPGHRFAPFVSPEIFPSEVLLVPDDGEDAAVELREITAPLSQMFHYALLLGSEQVFDFLWRNRRRTAAWSVRMDRRSR